MLFGVTQRGSTTVALGTATLYGVTATLSKTQAFSKLTAYLDGGGGDQAQQVVGVVLSGTLLVGVTDPVTISAGQAASWVDFTSAELGGMMLQPGSYTLALYGLAGNAARVLTIPNASEEAAFVTADVPESQSLPASLAAISAWHVLTDGLPFFATLFDPWTAPTQVDDLYLGRLPWEMSQRALGASAAIPRGALGTLSEVVCGWHGVSFDVETGAFAIARTGGAVESLVGERILVIRRYGIYQAAVAVSLYSQQQFPTACLDEDLSLTRRAFLGISGWEQDSVLCDILPLPS